MVTGDIWDQVLTRIETKVNRHSFYTWFKPTAFVADGGGELLVRVPNAVFRDWLGKHYAGLIDEALNELGEARVVQFVIEAAPEPPTPTVTPESWSRRPTRCPRRSRAVPA